MTDERIDETPWGEAQWERFMRESDVRSARYGELLETLIDHPDRDEIIAREMGWDGDDEDEDEEFAEWKAEVIETMNEPLTDEELEEFRSQRDDVDDIPAYARSFAWGSKLFHALKHEFGKHDDDLEELLAEAIGDSRIVAAKIAGGHGMGYDEDSLCGNIVCCKRSLEAAQNCLRGLQEAHERMPELRDVLRPLIEEGRDVQRLVEERIAELRSQVWWE